MKDSLLGVSFKVILTIVLPFALLITFASSLGISIINDIPSASGGTRLLNSYFGLQSAFDMLDDMSIFADSNFIKSFMNGLKLLATSSTFNLNGLIGSAGSNDFWRNIGLFFALLMGQPIIFLVGIIWILFQLIWSVFNVIWVLGKAFGGFYNIEYSQIYELPPLVENIIYPMFL